MSFDIFVQDLPAEASCIEDIPESFVPRPLGPRDRIIDAIRRFVPDVSFDDAGWASIEGPDFSIDVNLGTEDPVASIAFHLRGAETGLSVVGELLKDLGYRALAPGTSSGFFEPLLDAKEAYGRWRNWLASMKSGIARPGSPNEAS